MALTMWWMIPVCIAVAVVAIVIGVLLGLRGGRGSAGSGAPLARAERVRALPSFARAVRQRQFSLALLLIFGIVAATLAGLVASRPMAAETIRPENTSRDIMLCLDVSGSMTDVDVEIIDVFLELLKGFEGERIGLTIFNSSPVQVFPLTDDYTFVRDAMEQLRGSFDYTDEVPEHWAGTLNGAGASLIGDGLAACAMRFDNLEQERSRSIIFASDNEVNGASIVSVPEAAAYATSLQVRVFAINPVAGVQAGPTDELREAAESTGGEMYELRNQTTVGDIIEQVQQEQAKALQGEIQVVWSDDPNLVLVLFVVATLVFVLVMWRVRL